MTKKASAAKDDSELIKATTICWNELLDGFIKIGLSASHVDFYITEKNEGQIIIHFKTDFLRNIEKYYAIKSCCFSKEVLKGIEFKKNIILINKDHAICLFILQCVISFFLSEEREKFKKKIKQGKIAMKAGIKIATEIIGFPPAIKARIAVIYYDVENDTYFANIKIEAGRKLQRKVLLSSKDSVEEMIKKIKGKK